MDEPRSWPTMVDAPTQPPGDRLICCLTASATHDDGVRSSSLRQHRRPQWLWLPTNCVQVGGRGGGWCHFRVGVVEEVIVRPPMGLGVPRQDPGWKGAVRGDRVDDRLGARAYGWMRKVSSGSGTTKVADKQDVAARATVGACIHGAPEAPGGMALEVVDVPRTVAVVRAVLAPAPAPARWAAAAASSGGGGEGPWTRQIWPSHASARWSWRHHLPLLV